MDYLPTLELPKMVEVGFSLVYDSNTGSVSVRRFNLSKMNGLKG